MAETAVDGEDDEGVGGEGDEEEEEEAAILGVDGTSLSRLLLHCATLLDSTRTQYHPDMPIYIATAWTTARIGSEYFEKTNPNRASTTNVVSFMMMIIDLINPPPHLLLLIIRDDDEDNMMSSQLLWCVAIYCA